MFIPTNTVIQLLKTKDMGENEKNGQKKIRYMSGSNDGGLLTRNHEYQETVEFL